MRCKRCCLAPALDLGTISDQNLLDQLAGDNLDLRRQLQALLGRDTFEAPPPRLRLPLQPRRLLSPRQSTLNSGNAHAGSARLSPPNHLVTALGEAALHKIFVDGIRLVRVDGAVRARRRTAYGSTRGGAACHVAPTDRACHGAGNAAHRSALRSASHSRFTASGRRPRLLRQAYAIIHVLASDRFADLLVLGVGIQHWTLRSAAGQSRGGERGA